MRELVFKNLTSRDHKKRDVFIQETVTKDGVLAKTTRRCLYFVKERIPVKGNVDLKKIEAVKENSEEHKRHFCVLKERESETGVDRLMCKVAGTFYAMVDNYLYCIVFFHTFKITFAATKHK